VVGSGLLVVAIQLLLLFGPIGINAEHSFTKRPSYFFSKADILDILAVCEIALGRFLARVFSSADLITNVESYNEDMFAQSDVVRVSKLVVIFTTESAVLVPPIYQHGHEFGMVSSLAVLDRSSETRNYCCLGWLC
jgi:hypothetical protein